MRDIFLLIKRNQGLLNQIEGEYYALLEKKEIPDNLILDLKDFY